MKIGVDIRCLVEGRRSGVEEYTESLLKNLFVIDPHNEYVLFLNSFREPNVDLSWAEKFPRVTIKRFRIPNKILNFFLWYLRWPKIDRMLGGVDVFFAPNITFLALSKKAKLVLTVHDLSFELYPNTFTVKRRLWHLFVSPRRLVGMADRVIAVSRSTAEDLAGYYGVRRKFVRVIPSGVGDQYGKIDRNDVALLRVKEKYGLPYRFILFLGTIEPRKNIVSLVRAYEAFRATRKEGDPVYSLVIAGSSGWRGEALDREIGELSYKKDIRVIGFVEDADKPALYNLASIFVYPSLYEGFGFPVLEAFACAIPTITSHTSSLGEIAQQAAILTDPYKPQQISDALGELTKDKALADRLAGAGQRRAHGYQWQLTAHKTLEMFRSVLK